MVRVEALYHSRLCVYPFDELLLVQLVVYEASRLVGYLPCHDGGAVFIWLACHCIDARDDIPHVLCGKLFRLVVYDEVGSILHILPPSVYRRDRCLLEVAFPLAVRAVYCGLESYPVEVCPVASRPFPCVVEIQHSLHPPLLQLGEETVKSDEQRVVIHSRLCLQLGCYV